MVEIKCTKKQKGIIINAIREADGCASIVETDCDCVETSCVDCIERNIKWDIPPEPLKPCPCCGGEAEFVPFVNKVAYVRCKSCHLQTITYGSETQAAQAWNRRTTS